MSDWLARIEHQHPQEIDLDLARIRPVFGRLRLARQRVCTVNVAGTNGKGSCVAFIDSIFRAAGLRTGVYTSPHLCRFNERISVDGEVVDDQTLIAAFAEVEAARRETPLTYFEHSTLAALLVFAQSDVNVRILEVGMGGRLDAVNLVDADVAVITSIGLDHQDWLGESRSAIGREKAGIARPGQPVIVGDPDPPDSIAEVAEETGARLLQAGIDFNFAVTGNTWRWRGVVTAYAGLPIPGFGGPEQYANAACALTAVEQLNVTLRTSREHIVAGLEQARLAGRLQHIRGARHWILDVAHNGEAAAALAQSLECSDGRTIVIIGMMTDKPVEAVAGHLGRVADEWIVVSDGHPRSFAAEQLAARLAAASELPVRSAKDVRSGLEMAAAAATANDRIVITGSFHVVGPALEYLSQHA